MCILKTVSSSTCVLWDRLIEFIKRLHTEETFFIKPVVQKQCLSFLSLEYFYAYLLSLLYRLDVPDKYLITTNQVGSGLFAYFKCTESLKFLSSKGSRQLKNKRLSLTFLPSKICGKKKFPLFPWKGGGAP